MDNSLALEKLFGSKSRTVLLKFFLDNEGKQFGVNEVIRKTSVNGRLVSLELKKLTELGILSLKPLGNLLLYQTEITSPFIKSLKEIFANHDWFEWERPARIHHLALVMEAGLKPMKKYYGYCLPYTHLVFNYDNVTIFFKMKDFQEVGKLLIPLYERKKKEIWEDFNKFASTLGNHNNYSSFYKNYLDFWKVAYITEPISFYIDSLLKPGESISIRDKSFTDAYENKLWELAKQAKKKGINKIDLRSLLNEYFWIRNSYYGVQKLTEEDMRTEIKQKMGKKKQKIPKTKDPLSLPRNLVEIGKDMIFMQDLRKKYMMMAASYLHELLKKTGKNYNLTPTLMAETVSSEVIQASKKLVNLEEELKTRQSSCTITFDPEIGIEVHSGQILFPAGVQRKSKFEIKGRVACGGKAVGKVKIVRKTEDMYKVNHGDVIVSPMTTPDIMPAIRRCVAIVTDFGGITCHAAIISREFNIPCIVGTTNATEILKNEDLVEVDANNGIVKIIQSIN